MNLKKTLNLFVVLALLWTSLPITVFAEERNIYVGDIITLEIISQKFSENELREKFQDFEIVDIKRKQDSYLLSMRTFNVGEYTVVVGDKEMIISVSSTLDDIDRDGIFEGESDIIKSGFPLYLRIIFYCTASVFIISGCFVLVKILKKRKSKEESAYKLFLRRSASLSIDDDNYFVDLTLCFKEYIERQYECRIIGKTSSEIINELKEIPQLDAVIYDIKKWLTECDVLKFGGVALTSDIKKQQNECLLNIVEKVENNRHSVNEGMA